MSKLKYTVIKTEKQYYTYCNILEELLCSDSKEIDEIELLQALVNLYDEENSLILEQGDSNPVELIKALMQEHRITGRELAKILDVSEGLVSDMLNFKKAISKANAAILAKHFKIRGDAFLKQYELTGLKQRA